jgi:hypothetical protein
VEFSISRDELVPDPIPVTSTANEPITADEIDPSIQVPTPTVRRSTRIRIPRIIQSMVSLSEEVDNPYEPTDYQDAISCEDAQLWREKMDEEMQALTTKKTWILAPLPEGRKAIKCMFVYKCKPGYEGVAPRRKVRLVAKGYSQLHGIDYTETFAPVVKMETFRLVVAFAAKQRLEISSLDVWVAFLNGDLQEEIYMDQPQGYVDHDKPDYKCLLKKCIYGLKQAPRAWHEKFTPALLEFGLIQSQSDPCLFVRRQQGELLIVIIYVDDTLVFFNKKSTFIDLTNHLKQFFEIRVLPATRFVGIDIVRDPSNSRTILHQSDYAKKLLEKFKMNNCNAKSTPSDVNVKLSKSIQTQEVNDLSDPLFSRYREIIGGVMYLVVSTRPDMAQALNVLARFCENPTKEHLTAAKHLLAYLKGTAKYGLCFDANQSENLLGYADADFAGDLDGRKSTSGYLFTICGGPVAWSSRLQRSISQSTTEAEFVSLNEATREAVWLRRILADLDHNLSDPIEIRCDNQGAIRLVHNPENHQRTKHIEVKFLYVREQQERGSVNVVFVGTKNQLADGLTKSLPRPRFEELWTQIGVTELVSKKQ